MNGVRTIFQAEGLPAHCPCRGCAACGVFWDGVGAGFDTSRQRHA